MTRSTRIADKYRIIASGAGWIDQSARGRVRFDGPDALSFLQALLSNDVARLTAGQGVYTAYLTPNGRMIADLEILHRGAWLLAFVAPDAAPALAQRFDQLIFSENLRVSDASTEFFELLVVGVQAAPLISRALNLSEDALLALPESWQIDVSRTATNGAHDGGVEKIENGFVSRSGGAPFPAYRIVGPAEYRMSTVAQLEAAGIPAIDDDLVEALRIAAGRPAWGAELTSDVIPLEAGLLDRAISTTKGCYVGQEIVIRMLHRGGGRVAKRLVTLEFDESVVERPSAGTPLRNDAGADIGKLTSTTYAPDSGRVIALAYLRSEHTEIGTRVVVGDGTAAAAVTGFGG